MSVHELHFPEYSIGLSFSLHNNRPLGCLPTTSVPHQTTLVVGTFVKKRENDVNQGGSQKHFPGRSLTLRLNDGIDRHSIEQFILSARKEVLNDTMNYGRTTMMIIST